MMIYRSVATLLRTALQIFFREIHVAGLENVPEEGSTPVIFAGNHPNSLIDPIMIVATSGRIVHFAAKDKLFAFPLGLLLSSLGAVPIARAIDHKKGSKRDNRGALDALSRVLIEGRSMGIFPEGISHDKAHLQRIRSGAARVALETKNQKADTDLVVIPCGLTYKHRKRFRGHALVQFGTPIEIGDDWSKRWQEDERKAAIALTECIEEGIRALTVNAPDWRTLRVLDGVRRLYQPKHILMEERVELARRFCEAYERLQNEEKIIDLYTKVEAYLDDLSDLGLSDRDVLRGLNPKQLLSRALSNILRVVLWAPVALPGVLVHAPILLSIGWAGRRFAPRKDVIGTSRLMLGMFTVLGLYALIPTVIAWHVALGPALASLFLLPLSGIATLRVLERGASLRRIWRSAVAALTMGRRFGELCKRRRELKAQIVETVNEFRPEDMLLLFPTDSRDDAHDLESHQEK